MSTTLLDDIQSYMITNRRFMIEFINILLVWKKARTATLIETANDNVRNNIQNSLQIIFGFVKMINNIEPNSLYITRDKISNERFPRYFISSNEIEAPDNDEEIGNLLDFYCSGDDYGDYFVDRLKINIFAKVYSNKYDYNVFDIYTELCNTTTTDTKGLESNLLNKVYKFNNAMKSLSFSIEFYSKISIMRGLNTLIRKVLNNDIEFVVNNKNEYINFFNNFGSETFIYFFEEKFLQEPLVFLNTLKYLMFLCIPFEGKSYIEQVMPDDYRKGRNIHMALIEFLNTVKDVPTNYNDVYHIADRYRFWLEPGSNQKDQ